MKLSLLALTASAMVLTSSTLLVGMFPDTAAAIAETENWNGGPDPEPTPEPTPEPPRPVEPSTPTESWADRNDPKPMTQALPCCIMAGQLVLKPTLFMSAKRALRICEQAKANGAALIYECPGYVSPEAVK